MKRIVVTGGAGFVGSHLCEALLARGDEVVCVDNFSTGSPANLTGCIGNPCFSFVEADVCLGLDIDDHVDAVAHLACPASPPAYMRLGLETLDVGSRGTMAALDLAGRNRARFLLASTSEVYGDPTVHPQVESYWGNVNPVGPRSVYDESKRFSEALTAAHVRYKQVDAGIVRIFNTYGPRLAPGDGRVVSNFIAQALRGQPLTIFGEGHQTRSFCYVDDLVDGLVAMLDSHVLGPVNLGNPIEMSVLELARLVIALTGSDSPLCNEALPIDDPVLRQPDIGLARRMLGWQPSVGLEEGLIRTIEWHHRLADAS